MAYILGIDIGTSNTKAVGYTNSGKVVAHANRTYIFSAKEEGTHELNPDALFRSVVEVIQDAVKQAGSEQLTGISFSSAMHGLIAVDPQGRPLTNMITWADLRSNKYAVSLRETEKGKNIYRRTGTPIHPMSPLCKLMWLRETQPDIFSLAHKFISIKEYVFFKFFGEYIIDHSIASATGLFDIYDLNWNTEALRVAGITSEKLSMPVPATHIISGLKTALASQMGIRENTPFIIGGSDGCLAHIGSNAIHNGDVSLTIGTSGAVRIMTTKPVDDPKRRIFNYVLSDSLYVSGGPVNNGGNVLQWFAADFLHKPFTSTVNVESFIQQAMQAPPGCGGLVFLPYIYGERAPVWDADARGVFYGINGTHTVSHFMRAVMEGVCFGLRQILDTIEGITGHLGNIYVSGGFIRSDAWVAMLSDLLGKKLYITNAEDSSAAGAAIVGLKAIGAIKSFADVNSFFTVKEVFEPDVKKHDTYKANYEIYSALYDRLKDIKK